MAKVEFRSVRKSFGDQVILPRLDLTVESGEFLALVGPSGCGKSTLLRMLAGFEDPSEGEVRIDGRVVNEVSPANRGVSMVFQSYALYPHMTVAQNLEFPLKMARLPLAEIRRRVDETAAMLQLTELLDRKPAQMSGGQKQRVAMGRAMVRRPKVLLFDEPLSNLDAQLRVRVRGEIALLHRELKSTVLYVTHDQVEAMTLADRIAVLNRGSLEQLGAPLDVYRQPRTRFVASFIGTPPMNFLPVAHRAGPFVAAPAAAAQAGFRPEHASLDAAGGGSGGVSLGRGRVSLVEPLGSTTHVHVALGDGSTVLTELRGERPPSLGTETGVWVDPAALFWFDAQGARLA